MIVRPTTRPLTTSTPDRAACPACGGLKCLCRPRFFAGQLLTEEDLNRLDRYILDKNRLHNRYLQGWGIACGLEVVCHPCNDSVIVREGYALSACGDDIVVCKDVEVPVCDLIRQCKEKERRSYDCDTYPPAGSRGCEDECQDWVLFIRYDEKPSRGITALRATGAQGCCSTCSGASSACGCTCQAEPVPARAAASRQKPAQCEPTVTCEGFRFEVARARLPQFKPVPQIPGRIAGSARFSTGLYAAASSSGLAARQTSFNDCLEELVSVLPTLPTDATLAQQRQWCCDVKAVLQNFFTTQSTYDCQLDEKLNAITCPPLPANPQNDQQVAEFQERLNAAVVEMVGIGAAYLNYCLCSQFIAPCPTGDDPRVPLATITVCNDGCRVVKVCNMDVRRYLLSPASLQNLLDRTNLMESIQALLSRFCCRDFDTRIEVGGFVPQRQFQTMRTYAKTTARPGAFTNTTFRTWASAAPQVNTHTLLLSALGARDPAGNLLVPAEALRDPGQYVAATQFMRPLLDTIIPEDVARLLRPLATQAPETPPAPETPAATAEELRSEVESLRRAVAEQQARIDELLKHLGGLG